MSSLGYQGLQAGMSARTKALLRSYPRARGESQVVFIAVGWKNDPQEVLWRNRKVMRQRYGPQPTAHSLRPTAYGPQPTAHSLRPTAYGLLFSWRRLPPP